MHADPLQVIDSDGEAGVRSNFAGDLCFKPVSQPKRLLPRKNLDPCLR